MNWLFLALVSVLTISIANILERILLKEDESDPIGYAIIFQFLLGFIVLLFALLLGRFTFPELTIVTAIRFLISGMLWAGATTFTFKAVKRLSAAEVTILNSSSSLVSIIFSILLLSEFLDIRVVVGTFLVLISIYIVKSEKLSFESRQGISFALVSAFCSGAAVVNDALILRTYEVFSYVTIMSFIPGIILLALFSNKTKQIKRLATTSRIRLMVIFTFFYALQAVTYYLSYQSGAPISHLAPITKSSIVLTVIFGALFLKEKKHLTKKVLASMVVTAGVILLS